MIKIRTAKLKDLHTASEIYVDSWQNTYPGMISQDYLDAMSVDHAEEKLVAYITEPSMRLFVAVNDDDIPIGILACSLYTEIDDCGIVDVLHISKDYKGYGIGTELVRRSASYMLDHDCHSMAVDVVTANINAVQFYSHTGAVGYERYMDMFDGTEADSLIMMWNDLEGVVNGKSGRHYTVIPEAIAV